MKGDNRIPAFWGTCFSDGTFAILEKQADFIFDGSYAGVMTDWSRGDGNFSYICGIMMKEGVTVPEGFIMHEMDATKVGISWIKGKDTADVCSNAHEFTEQSIREAGLVCDNMPWSMELYNCPRYTTPDENGDIILDYFIIFSR